MGMGRPPMSVLVSLLVVGTILAAAVYILVFYLK